MIGSVSNEVHLRNDHYDADFNFKALFSYGKYGQCIFVTLGAWGLLVLANGKQQLHGETAENLQQF